MLSQRHLAPAFRPCLRSLSRPLASSSRRGLASSQVLRFAAPREPAPVAEEDIGEIEGLDELTGGSAQGEGNETPASYREFMEKIGNPYKFAQPQHYLGGKLPFPMNPSFKPPPPISDQQRTVIFNQFMADPHRNGVRRLAKRFNLSMKRVDAILRLKGMEKAWKKGKELQTGFQVGMDKILGATTHSSVPKLQRLIDRNEKDLNKVFSKQDVDVDDLADPSFRPPEVDAQRSDVHQADMLEQDEQRDAARYRYERLYWESVPEDGREPILPTILQHVKQRAELKKLADEIKKNKQFMTRVPETEFIKRPPGTVLMRHRRNRPSTKFVDVGAQFMDIDERVKRLAISERKSNIRAKKLERKPVRQT